MSDHDRALKAAAEALAQCGTYLEDAQTGEIIVTSDDREDTRRVVAAYLDSLLEGLPEEAVGAGVRGMYPATPATTDGRGTTRALAQSRACAVAFLRSLRTGLEGGTE